MGTSKSQQAILTEDGELRPVDAEPNGEVSSPEAHAVFCCNCGTANQASSRFCRACGQSLDEQAINPASLDEYAPPQWKDKRSADRAAHTEHMTPQEIAVMIEVMTLIVFGALAAVGIATQQTWIALVLAVVWLVVKVFQRVMPGNR